MSSNLPVSTPAAAGAHGFAGPLLRPLGLGLLGSLVLAVSAHLAVPFWPVPMTLQTLAVLMLGAFLGPRAAAVAVVAYWAEGAAGLPVFSPGATLFGPTTGYIAGFLPGAVVAGWAAERIRGLLALAAAFLAADALILAFGVTWLATFVGLEKAILVGVVPFLLGEALKIALTTAAVRAAPGLRP